MVNQLLVAVAVRQVGAVTEYAAIRLPLDLGSLRLPVGTAYTLNVNDGIVTGPLFSGQPLAGGGTL